MLLTRSIRRKLMFAMLLILVMVLILTFSAARGLLAFNELITEFRFSINDAPKQSELVKAAMLLSEPLLLEFHEDTPAANEVAAHYQRKNFAVGLQAARDAVAEYQKKLDSLPQTQAVQERRDITSSFLADFEESLDDLEKNLVDLGDPAKREVAAGTMLAQVFQLQKKTVQNTYLDHNEGLNGTLRNADRSYHSSWGGVLIVTGVVFVIFIYLVWYGYTGVFAPLRTLHQGAQRVAQGDFDYRVDIRTNDEVAELAAAFNRMTARFQEITRDLDRQVRERSKQLVRSDRLAGIGLFAAGIAHEINNPLSAIATAAEALEYRQHEEDARRRALQSAGEQRSEADGAADSEPDSILKTYLKIIQDEAFRCQSITRRILDFSRGQDAPRTPCDLANIVDEVISLVGLMSKYRGRQIEFLNNKRCVIEINGPEIKQVVLNLVTNALESMESGQSLRISITEQTDQVYLTLVDEGCGMTQEVIENMFEPFFTRRKDGRGTGLGMSISNRIIADHGGRIEVSSDGPGKGSTFIVHLPRKASMTKSAA